MIGLETATYRMQAIPGVMLGLLAASGLGMRLARAPKWMGIVALGIISLLAIRFIPQAHDNARRSTRSVKWEKRLVEKMDACENCSWTIKPRRRLGTRDRHDGCEIVQGLSDYRHGVDFWCTTWPGTAPFVPTHTARWRKKGYIVEAR